MPSFRRSAMALPVALALLALTGCPAPIAVTPEIPAALPTPAQSSEPTAPSPAAPVATLALAGSVTFHGEPLKQAPLALFDARTGAKASEGRLAGDAKTDSEGHFSLSLVDASVGEVYRLVAGAGASAALAGTFLVTETGIRALGSAPPAAGFRLFQENVDLALNETTTALSIAAGGPLRLGASLTPAGARHGVQALFSGLEATVPDVDKSFAAQPTAPNRVVQTLDPTTGWLRTDSDGDSALASVMPRTGLEAAFRAFLSAYSEAAQDPSNRQTETRPSAEALIGLGVSAGWGADSAVTVRRADGSERPLSASDAFTASRTGGSRGRSQAGSAPTISAITPNVNSTIISTLVTITGTGFTGATAVSFGSTPALLYTVISDTQISVFPPLSLAPGTVDVTVTTPNGSGTSTGAFSYVGFPTLTSVSPSSGAGGTTVTLTGTNLTGTTAVTFGSTPAASFTVNSATQITATAPAGTGTVNVAVTTPGGPATAIGAFTYGPTITSVSPNSGPTSGGTSVTITGSGFTGTIVVSFGGVGTTFVVNSDTQITATAPAHSAGAVDVVVGTIMTGIGTSTGAYTYVAPPPP